ncbi:MAG: hypothetical protein FWF06_04495 [Symbiobacteriaceae bacterium]|nr:hypothetical protein [Symbiobacteriaceae bacterium]
MRRTVPLILSFTAGILMILDSYFKIPIINNFATDYLMRSISVSVAWAAGLGSLNLIRLHIRHISSKRQNYQFSYVLIGVWLFMLTCGIFLQGNTANPFYQFFYSNIQVNLSAAVYSLASFYLASSCYRAFRARSVESTVLLVSAAIVMIGSVPVGAAIWSGFPAIQGWLLKIVNDSVIRGWSIGLTLGGLSQSVRNLVGIERGHLQAGE